jgi:hypothetical protein
MIKMQTCTSVQTELAELAELGSPSSRLFDKLDYRQFIWPDLEPDFGAVQTAPPRYSLQDEVTLTPDFGAVSLWNTHPSEDDFESGFFFLTEPQWGEEWEEMIQSYEAMLPPLGSFMRDLQASEIARSKQHNMVSC